jgi:hypothetical protein
MNKRHGNTAALLLGLLALGSSAAALTGCSAGAGEPQELVRFGGVSARGVFAVEMEVDGGVIPLNEPFELGIILRSGQDPTQPLSGRTLLVEGWMPGHGHGMLRRSQVDDLGDGHYRVRGMLFHMPGEWELRVKVIETRTEDDFLIVEDDQVSFEVNL